MASTNKGADAPITIKKYANRRLYNTATSSYVTLDHLCQMEKDGHEFVVYDAKTGDDITRSVLTQIIVEEEAKGENLLPIGFLRQLIGFYGDNMQRFLLPQYLDYTMKAFQQNQTEMQRYMSETFGNVFPFGPIEDMGKQHMAMFEKAMRMFTPAQPDSGPAPGAPSGDKPAPAAEKPAKPAEKADQIAELRRKLDDLERKIGSGPSGKPRRS